MSENEALEMFIKTELKGNLSILIDVNKKDSFSGNRVDIWSNLVAERIIHHLPLYLKTLPIRGDIEEPSDDR
tara:strand:+ start:383 stop:598 length:216 start_codon:yes stop_codon:yes gene_type:complete